MTKVQHISFTTLALAAFAFPWGDAVCQADPVSSTAIRGTDIKPQESPADRARALKAAAIKRRDTARKAMESVATGKPLEPTAAASENDTGGPK